MNPCDKCKFYTWPWGRCTRISNVNLKTKKNKPYRVKEAYKICKGYFFEHENELFSCADDALSDVPFFSDETSDVKAKASPGH